jgi:hypothetical protein
MSNTTLAIMAFMAIVGVMLMALSTTVVSVPIARAQGHADPPIGLFGNPNDFRPGPPIPSCNADFNQGPPDDPLKGCRDTP